MTDHEMVVGKDTPVHGRAVTKAAELCERIGKGEQLYYQGRQVNYVLAAESAVLPTVILYFHHEDPTSHPDDSVRVNLSMLRLSGPTPKQDAQRRAWERIRELVTMNDTIYWVWVGTRGHDDAGIAKKGYKALVKTSWGITDITQALATALDIKYLKESSDKPACLVTTSPYDYLTTVLSYELFKGDNKLTYAIYG